MLPQTLYDDLLTESLFPNGLAYYRHLVFTYLVPNIRAVNFECKSRYPTVSYIGTEVNIALVEHISLSILKGRDKIGNSVHAPATVLDRVLTRSWGGYLTL